MIRLAQIIVFTIVCHLVLSAQINYVPKVEKVASWKELELDWPTVFIQDSFGNIWFNNKSREMAQYDGHYSRYYGNPSKLEALSNDLRMIQLGSREIVSLTHEGLMIFDPVSKVFYNRLHFGEELEEDVVSHGLPSLLPVNDSTAMLYNLWILTGFLHVKSEKDSFNVRATPMDESLVDSLHKYKVRRVVRGQDNRYWAVGQNGLGLFHLNDLNFENYKQFGPNEFPARAVSTRCLLELGNDKVLVASADSSTGEVIISRLTLSNGSLEHFKLGIKIDAAGFSDRDEMTLDGKGRLWINFSAQKLLCLELSGFVKDATEICELNPSEVGIGEYLFDMMRTREGRMIFLGSEGVFRANDERLATRKYDLSVIGGDIKVRHVVADEYNGGYTVLLENSIAGIDTIGSIELYVDEITNSFRKGRPAEYLTYVNKERVIIPRSKDTGLTVIDNWSTRRELSAFTEVSEHCYNFRTDELGTTWGIHYDGVEPGIFSLSGEMLSAHLFKDNYYCWEWQTMDMTRVDSNAAIFIGSSRNIICRQNLDIAGENLKVVSVECDTFPMYFTSICGYTVDSILLASSTGAIYRMNTRDFGISLVRRTSIKPMIIELQYDSLGALWMRTYYNAYRFDFNSREVDMVEPGSRPVGFMELDVDGAILIPYEDFFLKYIGTVDSDDSISVPHVSSLVMEYVDGGTEVFNEYQLAMLNCKVSVDHDIYRVTFHVSSGAGSSLNEGDYTYRLIGLNDNWSEPTGLSQVSYTSLTPGEYEFHVGSGQRGRELYNASTAVTVQVLKPWYFSNTLLFTYFLLAVITGSFIYRVLLAQRLRKERILGLERMSEYRTDLYTAITHEFRTPLTVITGLLTQMYHKLSNAQQQRFSNYYSTVQQNAQTLLLLVEQLLDVERADASAFKVTATNGNIIPFIQYVFMSFDSMARSKNVTLTFYSEQEEILMDFDQELVRKILYNIVSNAIKYNVESGRVVCHVSEVDKGDKVCKIVVDDTGIGIPEAEQKKVFEKYYRVGPKDTEDAKGSGIGLYLSKRLVALLHGEITMKSKAGEGTQVTVELPIHQDRGGGDVEYKLFQGDRPVTDEKSSKPSSALNFGEGGRVLLIEDNRDIALYVTECLKDRYEVIYSDNGDAGLALALSELPDIVITDIMMPGISGIELCKKLKREESTSHIPIIMLTAKSGSNDRLQGLSSGADAYLVKPFNKMELLIRVENLIALRKVLWKRFSSPEFFRAKSPDELEPLSNEKFLRQVMKLVEDNISDPNYGQQKLAEDLHLSTSQTYRKIKSVTGKSSSVFIRWVRLQQSLVILENSDKSISEVAYECGFGSPSWFSRAFKEEFGYPPSAVIR